MFELKEVFCKLCGVITTPLQFAKAGKCSICEAEDRLARLVK